MNSDTAINRLREQVTAHSGRWKRVLVCRALGTGLAVVLVLLWGLLWLDSMLHLPAWGRLLGLTAFLGVSAALTVRLVRNVRRMRITQDQVALAVEQQTPGGLQNRLINALQLYRNPGEADIALARLAVRENVEALARQRLPPVVSSRGARIAVAAALVVLFAGGAYWAVQGARFANVAKRLFLPFAPIDPMYDTVLHVEPGDVRVDRGQDVPIRIRVEGKVPRHVSVVRLAGKERTAERVPVDAERRIAETTFEDVARPLRYSVRGGDYASRFFTVGVPVPARLRSLEVAFDYPDYTGLDDAVRRQTAGDLEALFGTRAALTFEFTHPVERATMLLETAKPAGERRVRDPDAAGASPVRRLALDSLSRRRWTGAVLLADVAGYKLKTVATNGTEYISPRYSLAVRSDEPPRLRWTGWQGRREILPDEAVPLSVKATDDYGLTRVGMFFRREQSLRSKGADGADELSEWIAIEEWPAQGGATALDVHAVVYAAELGAVEGERLRVALRGVDNCPRRDGEWATGPQRSLVVGGHGAALQRRYERILRAEAELGECLKAQDALAEETGRWVRRFDAEGAGASDNEQAEGPSLSSALETLAERQVRLRERTGKLARAIIEAFVLLKRSLAMVADTEMVRSGRILEQVPERDTPSRRRAALSEARMTQKRTVQRLRTLREKHRQRRLDWELANMMPLLKLLAERQMRMGEASLRHAQADTSEASDRLQRSMLRRQRKMRELTGLMAQAFERMGGRQTDVGTDMAEAFGRAAESLTSGAVKTPAKQALAALAEANWSRAGSAQREAGQALASIYSTLKEAKAATVQALADQLERQRSELEKQGKIGGLDPGSALSPFDVDVDDATIQDLVDMRRRAEQAEERFANAGKRAKDSIFADGVNANLNPADNGKRQDSSILKLAKKPGKETAYRNHTPGDANRVNPPIQEKFEDVVGDLLEETEQLSEQYQTFNRNAAFTLNEPGEIGKESGELNSTAAAAATGNQKPPSKNVGGASRLGRQGARSHGAAVGDKSVNRRGRDQAQQGQFRVPDQEGTLKEIMSDDPQRDQSTGLGGKDVDSDRANAFSTHDVGEWTEEALDHMGEAKKKRLLVERQGKPVDPEVATLLRDLTSQQEQVVERIKAVRKELERMYLPTEQLEDIERKLRNNLERLKREPSEELFRRQAAALAELRSVAVVFNQGAAGFEPSLRRKQTVRGRILDASPSPPLARYDDAVKRYYEMLAKP